MIGNDNLRDPFSSSSDVQTVHRSLNDLSEMINERYESISSDQSDINIKERTFNQNEVEDYPFDNIRKEEEEEEEKISNDQSKIFFQMNKASSILENLNNELEKLKIECQRVQELTLSLENQLISVKIILDKLSRFERTSRSLIISALNIEQNIDNLTFDQFQMLIFYTPEFDSITSQLTNTLKIFFNSKEEYQQRLKHSRRINDLLKQSNKYRMNLIALNDLLTKSVLSKSDRMNELDRSLRLPSNIFDYSSRFELFHLTHNVYIRAFRGQFSENDIHIRCSENIKHSLSQINYNVCEKSSPIFDIEFGRVVTFIDQLVLALPCFPLPSQSKQHISIRCKRLMDPLIDIPATVQIFNEISYAIFRLTESLSSISVEVVSIYPFQIMEVSNDHDLYLEYTSKYSSIFRLKIPKNDLQRSPRVRMIPFDSELLQFLKCEEQILCCSDLIEFQWDKETKIEGIISLTIQLNRYWNLFNQTKDQQQRKVQKKKIIFQRQKFEQEKSDEAGGSLVNSPTFPSSRNIIHLPSLGLILQGDHFTEVTKSKSESHSAMKSSLKWKIEGFNNENAPIILLGYKNRKWKNWNHFSTIKRTNKRDIYTINSRILLDRIIVLQCWPESNNETKLDKLAEHLWSFTSTKLFSCVLARDPSSFDHYGLILVPIQKQNLAEDILRQRNYTEFLFNEKTSKTDLPLNNRKYVQFCLSEGNSVRIVPMGNINIQGKEFQLTFQLHAQYPILIEFDVYPIDIYRQKTDEYFIGTLNIYQINEHHSGTQRSTSDTFMAPTVSSRRSSNSKDLEIVDNLSSRTSTSGSETITNIGGRSGVERLTIRDLSENKLLCSIPIRLPKDPFQFPSKQSNTIPVLLPEFFKRVIESLTEGRDEFSQSLNIHPALINSEEQKNNYSESNISLDENCKDDRQISVENETLYKWLKGQKIFPKEQTRDQIISALIDIGRIDLAYFFKLEYRTNQCE